ncbi:MAG: sodium:proton antiporter [Thermoguttaceae bacterium]
MVLCQFLANSGITDCKSDAAHFSQKMQMSEHHDSKSEHNDSSHQHEHDSHEHGGHAAQPSKYLGLAAIAIFIIIGIYGFLLSQGMPQKWTSQLVEAAAHHESAESHGDAANGEHALDNTSNHNDAKPSDTSNSNSAHSESDKTDAPASADSTGVTDEKKAATSGEDVAHQKKEGDSHGDVKMYPPVFMIVPFALLLICIAVLPLIPATEHWWENNLNRFLVAATLGFITLAYYCFFCNFPIAQHWPCHAIINPSSDGGFAIAKTVFLNAIIAEYIPFIVLLFSLFTISGGIRISGNLKASPFVNSVILLVGAILASFIGTTGAAMLLIRLLLETNKERKYKVHTIVFFIFCVCNCGGCLTPLGDPPLFLGYLKGVAFTWTLHLWKEWAFVNLILIGFYFIWDTLWFYRRENKSDITEDNNHQTSISISGWQLNVPLLAGVIFAVALLDPSKPFIGTDWHPWYFLRETIQMGLCGISLAFGSKQVRIDNVFNFGAIIEVAALFFGIFICMQAPLQILNHEGKNLGIDSASKFFWATGTLSSVLDNAPTYVVFFETARSISPNSKEELKKPEWSEDREKWERAFDHGEMVHVSGGALEFHYLVAISLGAVFMGSMTYIGNGPNFMVKAIAEQSGVKMPSFFGYMMYSCVILLPILVAMVYLFIM